MTPQTASGLNQSEGIMGFDRDVRGKLVLHDGPLPGYEIELIAGEVVIGRDPRVDFTIDHAAVSGRHAFITRQKGAVSIEDLGSTNGTFLNAKPPGPTYVPR